ncbi:MAG: bifunctional salicylyl-CoA 5-hydroxylase/oxidoreductase [Candidatus Krumholzibacteria bacterium]|nr:bifunctional salicylyl-CoA 5-hydroxylase/oxidoreductase [Candidatus Krumholzibacteria bacterium]MDH4336408.1 bifunctional salicylyl-CoA 5-hydroxylase/oxidoreductase [Candidatus Krumholzibacteria bacterium]
MSSPILVIGGGPAGLYFSIQMKLRDPQRPVRVLERNPRGSTFGWGVVFSDGTLGRFREADADTYRSITDRFVHWDDIDVFYRGRVIRSGGHGFCGISRQALLDILVERAEALGVDVRFGEEIRPSGIPEAGLVVAADGVNSAIRAEYAAHFKPDVDVRRCKYVWLGTRKAFDAFTFYFEETPAGWYQAHCYPFGEGLSTFIVECTEETWRADGLDRMSTQEGIAFCERLFASHLGEERLVSNAAHLRGSAVWLNFSRVSCEKWHHGNIVLLGDSAATAHFSVGSGTKLAMESAISLAEHVKADGNQREALEAYESERRVEVLRLQNAARNSTEWFEEVGLKANLEPEQFAYSLITRSQRVSHESLRARDPGYLAAFESWLCARATDGRRSQAVPPMFLPFRVGEMELVNRIACSPMAMYSAIDGTVNDFHLVHLGSRALGGAGLIFTEMTCVSPEGRITPGCAGMYAQAHADAYRRIVDFIHRRSDARVALQLGHAGRKASTRVPWEGGEIPLASGNWPIMAPSAIPWTAAHAVPREMTRDDMDNVVRDFVAATQRAIGAGFDALELHCAHGYLLSSFISPLTNRRADAYGGSLENRMRFPLEVLAAVRAVWPRERPLGVRVSATDWVEGGIGIEDSVAIARMVRARGADFIDVSAGQVTPDQKPVYGRMFQVPFAERIRLETGMATLAVGNIYEPDHANSIIAAGRADLCLLARPHLWDPMWTLRAAAQTGYEDVRWPEQYDTGRRQLETLMRRAREAPAEPI